MAVFWILAALRALLDTTDLRRMHELREVAVPEAWRGARIFLDHTPCENVSLVCDQGSTCRSSNHTDPGSQCWKFLHRINQATGIHICVDSRPFLVKGDREGAGRCQNCPCDRCKGMAGNLEPKSLRVDRPEEQEDGDIESVGSDEATINTDPEVRREVDPPVDIDGFGLRGNDENDGHPQRPQIDQGSQLQQTAPKPPKVRPQALLRL